LHGFLLGYEKTRQIQAAKNRRKKALAFFYGSARVGLLDRALTELQFLEGPPYGGFSFGYVIGFPSNSCERAEAAEVRNRLGRQKSVNEESGASKRATTRYRVVTAKTGRGGLQRK